MNLLLNERLAPITSEIGFIECDLRTTSSWFGNWRRQIAPAAQVQEAEVSGSIESMARTLLPLTSVLRRRFLLVACERWTAYFDNGWRGADTAALAHVAKELGTRAVRVVAVPDSPPRYGASIFELYGPTPTEFLNYVRSVAASNDGGMWTFSQAGTPLPFENLDVYKARSVRARFPFELLDNYLGHLGIRAFDEAFYKGPAVLVSVTGPMPPTVREYSLEEARASLGLR